jgi:hypothetical protein
LRTVYPHALQRAPTIISKIYCAKKKKKRKEKKDMYLFAPNVRDILCRWGAAEVRDQLHLIDVCKQSERQQLFTTKHTPARMLPLMRGT